MPVKFSFNYVDLYKVLLTEVTLLINPDDIMRKAALKLRKIRELKKLSRNKFCDPMLENSEYWGQIERGDRPLSMPKFIQACVAYNIEPNELLDINYQEIDDTELRLHIQQLLSECNVKQLEIINKFIEDIALTL